MDCEFFESEFYCNRLRCQREKQDDDLRWLTGSWMSNLDQNEQVGGATERTYLVVQSIPQTILSEDQVSNLANEHESLVTNIVDVPNDEIVEAEKEETGENHCQNYVLPPRTTRGVPPKRYDLDFESRRSRYPIEQPSEGNMSQSAMSFNAALHRTNLPNSVEEP